ncbi:hypothetical protein ES703_102698 [subsurface metagenome]
MTIDKREEVARKLHFIDWFMKQLPISSEWDELTQGERNSYLNYAGQVIHIVGEG